MTSPTRPRLQPRRRPLESRLRPGLFLFNRPKPGLRPLESRLQPGPPAPQSLFSPCFIFSTAWSMVKLAGRWLGGNSLNVSRNLAVPAAAPRTMKSWSRNQSVGVRGDVRPLVRVGMEVEQLGRAKHGERLGPHLQG